MAATVPQPGQMELYDNYIPGIGAGTYTITLTQDVDARAASVPNTKQTFHVAGPRFQIDPADIHAQFPPPGSTGRFDHVLPHVTFNKRVLPWEREVPQVPQSVPWVALLVFEDGELAGDRGGGDFAETIAVSDLIADPGGPVRKPNLLDVTDAEKASRCRAITIASDRFAAIAPTAAEATLLAHVRCVPVTSSAVVDMKDQGQFSVVVANRFPAPGDATHGAGTIVHLVSLEGFHDLLGGVAPIQPSQKQIQLVSLASWTFSCLADPAQTFRGLARNLVDDANGAQRTADSLGLRLPGALEPTPGATALGSQAQRRLAEGFVALEYHARTGDDGFAWYRGPFSPVVPAPIQSGGFASADAAMQFDPQTGLFDHSLAAAWQAGRSLALADEGFATALMRVRHAAMNGVVRSIASREAVHDELGALFGSGLIEAMAAATAGAPAPPARAAAASPPAPRPAYAVRAALAEQNASLDAADPADVDAVTQWLAMLELLYPLPFAHLVPDPRMLPPESIRFFYVDPAWIGAMVDGALSIGVGTSLDLEVQRQLTEQLEAAAAAAARAYRSGTPGPPAATGPTAGLLLRSAMASGWPGLTVTGTAGGADVPLLRLDHLSPTVLLCLFNGVPDTITLGEPHESLEFGVDGSGFMVVRDIQPPVGQEVTTVQIYGAGAATGSLRGNGSDRVLNVTTGGGDLVDVIVNHLPGSDRAAFGPAAFGLQMITVPETVAFETGGGS